MAEYVGLHDLVGAIAGAIVDAQSMVERRYIDRIGAYFDEQGRPISFEIKLPHAGTSTDDEDYLVVGVPFLSLVQTSMLSISRMQIDLEVGLGEMEAGDMSSVAAGAPRDVLVPGGALRSPTPDAAARSPDAPDRLAAQLPPRSKGLAVQLGSVGESTTPTARVSVVVEAREPSEGQMRLLNQLNKIV